MENTRVDKNVIDNILDLRQFGDDSMLMKTILFYFAWKRQNSLYDFGTFDIDQFSKELRLSLSRLNEKHPTPKHVERLTESKQLSDWKNKIDLNPEELKYRIFDTNIENALYRLYTENLVFSGTTRQYVSEDGSTNTVYPLERIVFLTSLKARHIKTKKGQTKIVYDYTLNESFVKNLSLHFSRINLSNFMELRKGNIEDLYIYLKNLKDILRSKELTQTDSVSFEFLCELANVQIKENKDRKKWLIKKFRLLSERIGFPVELTFKTSSGHRWAYQPVINFSPDHEMENKEEIYLKHQREEIFLDNFLHNLTEIIKQKYPDRKPISENFHQDIIDYCRWNDHHEQKQQAYLKAQEQSFINPHPTAIKRAILISEKLLNVKSIADINNVILGR